MARLYEYQGKQLLKTAKVPVPQGEVATTPQEVANNKAAMMIPRLYIATEKAG